MFSNLSVISFSLLFRFSVLLVCFLQLILVASTSQCKWLSGAIVSEMT